MKVKYRIKSNADKNVSIYVSIWVGKAIECRTGLTIHPNEWSVSKERNKGIR